ncbi:hypothetical protein [Ramlibacter sp.]|uniref:hypothetical protein n=1 Tax=Ramlibacter sp. TaxID=1917967 RepID=UPI0017AF27FF|nr:hypothetical protein [Ramlibacter sp.]MBA2673368.1 hypothetical protein [Ramlibacter sp.]
MTASPESYFDLQLRFAAHYARIARVPLRAAVDTCTNLRRRFGWMDAGRAAHWEAFLHGIAEGADHAQVLRQACETHAARGPTPTLAKAFGCFSYEVHAREGVLRIHFMEPQPRDPRAGPLARLRMHERLAELRALFAHVRAHHPEAVTVLGVSWLYNLDAYKRLFPPGYGASAALPSFPLHLSGSSTWGQVLDHDQQVKPDVRDALLARLDAMAVQAPWRVFALQALVASSPIACFHAWYG